MRGIVYPSAALPGTWNAAIFGELWEGPYDVEPVSVHDVPTTISAEDGRPLTSLLERVRLYGEPHAGLEAWESGIELTFEEPSFERV